jgi:ZIP family zinc transporter
MSIGEVIFWAFISVTGIIIGSVIGLKFNLSHSIISKIVALASGLLVATATVELFHKAIEHLNLYYGLIALFVGALSFSCANVLVSKLGAKNRKRCGVCMAQPSEETNPGSGLAIMVGTAMDAIPEALVLGLALKEQGIDYALLLAIALGNLPEAISSSSGMKEAGRSHKWIFSLWGFVSLGTIILTVLGFLLAEHLSHEVIAMLELFGAGALLSLVAETLIPEATHGTPKFAGLLIVLGFILLMLF